MNDQEKNVEEVPRELVDAFGMMVMNTIKSRAELYNKFSTEDSRDINAECGYPDTLSVHDCKLLYDREGISTRIVSLFPEETWVDDPMLFSRPSHPDMEEKERNKRDDAFANAWRELQDMFNIFHYLSRIDEISGIGHFGILLLGTNDGGKLCDPIPVVEEREKNKNKEAAPGAYALHYLRPFDASVITVSKYDNDPRSPRYGSPVEYQIKMNTYEYGSSIEESSVQPSQTVNVHWTRVIHVADNRKTSEVFGVPRMQTVYNRLYDLRKVLGGSGEMFWKGGFPGYSFEVSPEVSGTVTIDKNSLKNQIDAYTNSLQRYIALEGMTAKSLAPQVADPDSHVNTAVRAIAISMGVPYRIFAGSEEAKLASSEDTKRWNKRIRKRRDKYVNPLLIRPFVDRLISLGVLPQPERGYCIKWPDLNEETNKQKAETFETKARGYQEAVKSWAMGGLTDDDLYNLAFENKLTGLEKEEFLNNLRNQGEM